MKNQFIFVGVISSPYHLKGLVKISSFTQDPKNICNYLCFDNKENEYRLKFVRMDKKKIIAKIDGISNRNEAEKVQGTKLYIRKEDLPEPSEDEYYIDDLIGLDVLDKDDKVIGKVKAMHNFGAGDIVEIAFKGIKQTELLPFTEEFFPKVTKDFVRYVG